MLSKKSMKLDSRSDDNEANETFYQSFHLVFCSATILGTMPYKYNQIGMTQNDKLDDVPERRPKRCIWLQSEGFVYNWRKKLTLLWTVCVIVAYATSLYILVFYIDDVYNELENDMIFRRETAESSLFLKLSAATVTMCINFIHGLREFHRVPQVIDKLRCLEKYATAQYLYEEKELKKLRSDEALAGFILSITLLLLTISSALTVCETTCKSLASTNYAGILALLFFEVARILQFSLDLQIWILLFYIGNRCKLLNRVLNDVSEQIRQSKEKPLPESPHVFPILRTGRQQSVFFDVENDSSFTVCKKKTRRYYPVLRTTMREANCLHRCLSDQLQDIFSLYQLPILLLVLSAVQNIGSALFTLFIVSTWDVAMHEVGYLANNIFRLAIVFIPLSLTAEKVHAALKYLSLINNACLPPDCSFEVQLFARRVLKAPLKLITCRLFKCSLFFLGRMSLGIVSYLLIMLQYSKTVSK